MDQVTVSFHYDAEMDIFSAWLRQPKAALSVEPLEGIVVRSDADTDEFVGYTVLDCRRRFGGTDPATVTLPLVPAFALVPLRAHLHFAEAALAAA